MSTMTTFELVFKLVQRFHGRLYWTCRTRQKIHHKNFNSGSSVDVFSTHIFCNKDVEKTSFGHNFAQWVNEQVGGVVCSLWRSLLQINFVVLLHGICFVCVPNAWFHEEIISPLSIQRNEIHFYFEHYLFFRNSSLEGKCSYMQSGCFLTTENLYKCSHFLIIPIFFN